MCVTNMANIAADQCANRPGLKTVLALALSTDITSIGAAVAYAVSTITPVATKGFYRINCSRKENDQKSTPNENGGYTTEVKYFVTRQAAAKSGLFTQMNSAEAFVGITEDQNAEKTIIGSLDHPAMVKVEATKTPRNGYNVTLMWEEHADLPLHFTGSIPYAA